MVVEIFEFELNCRVSFWCGASPQFSSTIALGKIGLTGNMSTSYSYGYYSLPKVSCTLGEGDIWGINWGRVGTRDRRSRQVLHACPSSCNIATSRHHSWEIESWSGSAKTAANLAIGASFWRVQRALQGCLFRFIKKPLMELVSDKLRRYL
jgi:hypothetical protein